MPGDRRVVAHLHSVFFQRSETFIYNVLVRPARFTPLCVAWRFENLDEFPFPAERRFAVSSQGVLTRLLRKLFDINPGKERFLKKHKTDLLHAHFGPSGFGALSLRRRLHLPLVTTFYGYDISALPQHPAWTERYRMLFQEGDLFLVEGEYMRSKLERLGCRAEKIRIQKILIPLERFQFRARSPKRSGEKTVLIFSGRFVEKKGLLDALEAVRRLRERRSDFEFRLVGDGPLRAEVEAFIGRHAMGAYVKPLGFLGYDGYLAEMDRADIFVHPSVVASNGDDEGGAPTTILEAQALGLPVVSTRHADIPNIVVEGKSALLCAEGDVNGLVRNLESLLDDPSAWEAMSLEGRKFVETHHELNAGIKHLEGLYMSLLERTS